MKKKIAIIGASYLQRPLVERAKNLGIETHVFAWEDGNEVSDICSFYYPISVLEKELILEKCIEIKIDGILTIASDISVPTVDYIADKLNLTANSLQASLFATNKYIMRKRMEIFKLICPDFELYNKTENYYKGYLKLPLIIKPTDRSGSVGVSKIDKLSDFHCALDKAINASLKGEAIVEKFIESEKELSVEMISRNGEHHFLAITDKLTSGSPYFVEMAHCQPAVLEHDIKDKIIGVVSNALDALEITNGASHTEVLVTSNKEIVVLEAAARMGGDHIGAILTPLSTKFDYLKAVIDISLGKDIEIGQLKNLKSGIVFVTPPKGKIVDVIINIQDASIIDYKILKNIGEDVNFPVERSSERSAYIIYQSEEEVDLHQLKKSIKFIIE